MPRKGLPVDRMGARVRIGRVNDGVDHTPYIFQQEGIIQRVGTPDEIKRGIIGYTSRGVVTIDGLKKKSIEQFQSKIKNLEQRKKDVSPNLAKIYKEGQDVLQKLAQQTREAKKLGDIIPFTNANEIIGGYVNLKFEVVSPYSKRIDAIEREINSANQRIERIRERQRTERDREWMIKMNYDVREYEERIKSFEKERGILNEYLNKNINEVKFGEEIFYYPYKQVSRYANEVRGVYYANQLARIDQVRHRVLHRFRSEEMVKKQYPHLTSEQVKKVTTDFLRKGEAVIHPRVWTAPDGTVYHIHKN